MARFARHRSGRGAHAGRRLAQPVHGAQQVRARGAAVGGRAPALGEDRAGRRGGRLAAGGQEHPPEPRRQRQPRQAPAERRDPAVAHRPQPLEPRERRRGALAGRRLEPAEGERVGAPGEDGQERTGEIDPQELRLAMRALLEARVPQPGRPAGTGAAGASGALLGGVARDALGLEAVEAGGGIQAQHLVQARVDDFRDALDGERGLGQIRRQDDLAPGERAQRPVLRRRVERAVERQDKGAGRQPLGATQLFFELADLRRAGEEAEQVPAGRSAGLRRRRERGADRRQRRELRRVAHHDGMEPPRRLHDRTAAQVIGDARRIEGGRHHHQPQVVPRPQRFARQRQGQVGVHGALVELVQDDGLEAGEQRIALQARGEDALGRDQQAGARREAALETHLPAHLLTERPALLLGDPPRQRARRDPPRLEEEERAVAGQDRRHARRLARSRRRDHDQRAPLTQAGLDLRQVRIDRERRGHSAPAQPVRANARLTTRSRSPRRGSTRRPTSCRARGRRGWR